MDHLDQTSSITMLNTHTHSESAENTMSLLHVMLKVSESATLIKSYAADARWFHYVEPLQTP